MGNVRRSQRTAVRSPKPAKPPPERNMILSNYEQMHKIAQRIRQTAINLGVRRIVFGECGHAWRVAYAFLNTLVGPWDFLDPVHPVPQHIVEVTHELIRRGGIVLDRDAPIGFDSRAARARQFAAEAGMQAHALLAAAEGALAAYAFLIGEDWKPYEGTNAPVSREAAAAELDAFS